MNASEIIREMYEAKKINALYEQLKSFQEQGQPRYYEIQIDKFPVIAKTQDLDRFESYSEHIEPDSKFVSVLLFKNNKHADKYFFYFTEGELKKGKEMDLKGLPEENKSNALNEAEMREKVRKDLHYEELIKENALLKSTISDLEMDLEEASEGNDALVEELKWYKSGKAFVEGVMGIPVVGQFLGQKSEPLSGTPQSNENPNQQQGSFKAKGEEEKTEDATCVDVTKEEKRLLATLDDVRTKLGHAVFETAMALLNQMAPYPESVNYAKKQVENFLKTKGFM